MSKSYLPHEITYAVCSFDVAGKKREFVLGENRLKTTKAVYDTKYPLLTIDDRALSTDFECKNNWSGPVSWGALAAGIVIGAALILSGPVGLAVLAVAAGAAIVAGAVAYSVSKAKKCTPELLMEWVNPHPTVYIESHQALTKNSFLPCGAGGVITPFINADAADVAARSVANRNLGELGLIAGISFLGGMGLGAAAASGTALGLLKFGSIKGLGSIGAGTLAVGTEVGVGVITGYGFNKAIEHGVRPLQDEYLSPDNPMLDDYFEHEDYLERLANEREHLQAQQLEMIQKIEENGAPWQPSDMYEIPGYEQTKATRELLQVGKDTRQTQNKIAELQELNARAEAELIKQNQIAADALDRYNQSVERLSNLQNQAQNITERLAELQRRQQAINQALETARQQGTLDRKLNQDIAKVYERIRNGEFGQQAQETLFGKNGDGRGRNVPSNYEKINEAIQQDIAREQQNMAKNKAAQSETEKIKNQSKQQQTNAEAQSQSTKNKINSNNQDINTNQQIAESHTKRRLKARVNMTLSIATLTAPIVHALWSRVMCQIGTFTQNVNVRCSF